MSAVIVSATENQDTDPDWEGEVNAQAGKIWRRGWDLNPRYPLRYVRFRGGSFQPLTHLSALKLCWARRLRFPGRFLRSFASLRISPVGSRFAHARKSAQFQP